jgi:hypothetical protein
MEPNMTEEQLLREIREHPERHRHDFNGLTVCSMVGGAISLMIMEAHAGVCGWNGSKCDVTVGPCSCGGWH